MITPPQNIIGAAAALPGAAEQGVSNFLGSAQSISPLSTPGPSTFSAPQSRTTNVPAVVPTPAVQPKLPTVPNLTTIVPQNDPPKTDPPKGLPGLDALSLPKLPSSSNSTSPRGNLPTLGELVNSLQPKSTASSGGNAGATKPPGFGAGRPAGVISGALKNLGSLADGLTGKKPAAAAEGPAASPAA